MRHTLYFRLAVCCFLVLVMLTGRRAFSRSDFEMVEENLDKVVQLYQTEQYEEARAIIHELKEKVFEESADYGMEYPISITMNIKYLDNLLKDEAGYFDDISSYQGIIIDLFLGHTGYIDVQGDQGVRRFIYERDVLIKGETMGKGKEVVVYFQDMGLMDIYMLKKIVVSP